MAQQRGGSLGSALFGFSPAEGCSAAGQAAPDSWRIQFPKHADGEVLAGLFRSCRAGKALALESAARATFTLQWNEPLPSLKRLQVLRDAFIARAPRKLFLRIICSVESVSTGSLAVLLGLLVGYGPSLEGLELSFSGPSDPGAESSAVAAFLQQVAGVCPALSSLRLDRCFGALPARAELPQLTQLSVTLPPSTTQTALYAACGTISTLIPQLTNLTLITTYPYLPWPGLFSASNPLPLTHFTTDAPLTDQLLDTLLLNAPGLTQVSVGQLQLQQGRQDRQWGVGVVCVDLSQVDSLSRLLGLPVSRAGKVVVKSQPKGEVMAYVCSTQVREAAQRMWYCAPHTHTRTHLHLQNSPHATLQLGRAHSI